MKKLLYILMFFFPVVASAQFNLYKDSPLDYAWKNVGNAGFSIGQAYRPSLAINPIDGSPYMGYEDGANSYKATVMRYNGINWVNVGNAGFSAGIIYRANLAFSQSGQPYILFSDEATSPSLKATVMKFDVTSWVNVGEEGFSAGMIQDNSLAFSPSDGQPYAGYSDETQGGRATVMKFNGTDWVNVGVAGFSDVTAAFISLAFSPSDGQPYVAFADFENSFKANVMKFDGISWVNVGIANFSQSDVMNTSLAFCLSDNQPYIAYCDGAHMYKATVMRFDGTNWVNLGNAGFSAGSTASTSLAFSPSDGQPYVAYNDGTNMNKATVMKFDGTNWVNAGSVGFSAGQVDGTDIAFDQYGQPFIGYQDYGNANKATVMKYDSVFAGINELLVSPLSIYPNPTLTTITIETPTKGSLSINNCSGQQLITRPITESRTQIDISNLPSGVYFVRVTNERTVEVGKIVKQ
jgi:Secretion system C-terminal sorting domain